MFIWLVLKLEISFNSVIIILKAFLVSFLEELYFCMVKYFESFHNSSFAFTIPFLM